MTTDDLNILDTERPGLEARGFTFDGGDAVWSKKIETRVSIARKDHTIAGGRIILVRKGQRYTRTTWMNIADSTGDKWMTHTKRV
jgi:hypothetical protein